MSNNKDITDRVLVLLDNAVKQAEQCTKTEMRTLVCEIESLSSLLEDDVIGYLIRAACKSLLAVPSSSQRTKQIGFCLHDIKKVQDRIRLVRNM